MPGLEDELFSRSVVYVCEHSEQGAMGLIINKPSDLSLRQLFDKVDLPLRRDDLQQAAVLHGGPLQTERGFVLHDPIEVAAEVYSAGTGSPPQSHDEASESGTVYGATLAVDGGLELTTSRDVLQALASGVGPRRVLVTLGYAGWGQGQLESELAENAWLTVPASADVVFDTPPEQRYLKALGLLGLQPWMLSPQAGRA